MQQFELSMPRDLLSKGLRSDRRAAVNTFGLTELLAAKPTEWGIIAIPPISEILDANDEAVQGIVRKWPFPVYFKGKWESLLVDETTLYASAEGPVTALDPLTLYRANDPDVVGAITGDGAWNFIDMHSAWMLLNGTDIIVRPAPNALNASYGDKYYVNNDFKARAGCFHERRGQMFLGGFSPSMVHPVWGVLERNMVCWSSIGGGDAFWPMFPNLVPEVAGGGPPLDHLQRLDSGYAVMPFSGTVQAVLPLGNNLMVYSDSGVAMMQPGAIRTSANVFPGWGTARVFEHVGIADRLAAVAGRGYHVFVDENGVLWRISIEGELTRLGYEEFLENLVSSGKEIVMSYDEREEDIYICTADEGYILTKTGLGRLENMTSGLSYYNGLRGVVFPNTLGFGVRTGTFDMGRSTLKTITEIEVGYRGVEEAQVTVHWNVDGSNTFGSSICKKLSPNGTVRMTISGRSFQVDFNGIGSANTKLDWIKINYQAFDRSSGRGTRLDN